MSTRGEGGIMVICNTKHLLHVSLHKAALLFNKRVTLFLLLFDIPPSFVVLPGYDVEGMLSLPKKKKNDIYLILAIFLNNYYTKII